MSGVWKLCQRRLYSWLSSRCGLPICIVGLLLVAISALQFGEILLEWSKERYAVQFSIYADNVAAKSYERQLCPPLPIDIVYTWVNGTDPVLLENLRELKRTLAKKDTANSTNTSTTHSSPTDDPSPCPFNHCVTWRTLIIDASNLTHPLTLENIGTVFPSLDRGPLKCTFFNASKLHGTPVYAVRMATEEQVTSVLKTGLVDNRGSSIPVVQGFLTSDHQLVSAIRIESFYIALSDGIRPLNSSSRLFSKWLDSHFPHHVLEAEVKANRTAVVSFKQEGVESVTKTIPYKFSGENVSLYEAYLVWLPFSLPNTQDHADLERPDIVSASRFQDNEELRYSLRSVERFAPWVRHIFIVTNGQIPSWLNLDSPRVTLVTHEEIFPNHTHLPTYSSPAIESHLHQIPGLADHFIYLNDDVMFGDYVWPEDFYTYQHGQKVYLSWPVPNCAEGCPPSWIRDHYCDANCNNSACDWDGGDCANATRPGPQGVRAGYSHSGSSDYCGPGCLNSWLGDRYCDSACRTPDCGYDAGDCGTEKWEELLGYTMTRSWGNYSLPLGTTALYFNLTNMFFNGTIFTAHHSPSDLIRTAIVAQKYKALALTLSRNVSRSSVNFTISGNSLGSNITVTFTLTGDTATKNTSKVLASKGHTHLAVDINDTSSREFLEAVIAKLPSNKSVKYWIEERALMKPTQPASIVLTRYSVANMSFLPPNVSQTLQLLDKEWQDGDLTRKGYLKQRAILLRNFSHLVRVNGTEEFGHTLKGAAPGPSVGANEGQLPDPRVSPKPKENAPGGGGGVEEPPVVSRRSHGELLKRLEEREEPGIALRNLLEYRAKDDKTLQQLIELAENPPILEWVESRRRFPWEKFHLFPDTPTPYLDMPTTSSDMYKIGQFRSRRLMAQEKTDTFADSLRYVNRLYTRVYGHTSRKVPSHMPHFIQKEVMIALQDKFPEEFAITSSHPVRMADDMQFSFSYLYFLMSEKLEMVIEDVFADLDTDHSSILSVRELRTLLAMISDLPISMSDVTKLEDILKSCDHKYNWTRPSLAPVEYETLYDSKLPLVTLNFTRNCPELVEKLNKTVTSLKRYKFQEVTEDVIGFKMISENGSEVSMMLDELRKKKKKFICLNDNIDHSHEGAEMAKLILLDFYESLFPTPSQFELPGHYRNRFLHVDKLKEWLALKDQMNMLLYVIFCLLLLLSLASLFYGKLVQFKRRTTRWIKTRFSTSRTHSSI